MDPAPAPSGRRRPQPPLPPPRPVSYTGLGLSATLGAGAALTELGSAQHHAAEAAAHRHPVDAIALTAARPSAADVTGNGSTGYRVQASWTYPPGHSHTGTVAVAQGTQPGAATLVWVGDSGLIAATPHSEADLVGDAIVVGLLTLLGLSMVAGAAFGGRCRRLDQQAADAWQHVWEETEPVWSGRARAKPDKTDSRPD